MKDEFKRAMNPPGDKCGWFSCPFCGPKPKEKSGRRRSARQRLKHTDRELFDYYWDDRRCPPEWRDDGFDEGWGSDTEEWFSWDFNEAADECTTRGPYGPDEPEDLDTSWVYRYEKDVFPPAEPPALG